MAGSSKASKDDNVGRRRSHEYESAEYVRIDNEHYVSRVVSSNANLEGSQMKPGEGTEPTPTTLSPSQPTRVSTGNGHETGRKKRKSDEISRGAGVAKDTNGVPEESASSDTYATSRGLAERMEELSSRSAAQKQAASPGPSSSSRSRVRGMSLRTSLFTRNVHQRSRAEGTTIEMQDAASSSNRTQDTSQSPQKSFQSTVSVQRVTEGYKEPRDECRKFSGVSRHRPIRLPSSRAAPTSRKNLPGISNLSNYQRWFKDRADLHSPVERLQEAYTKIRRFLLRIQEIPPSKDGRHIPLNALRKEALIDERTGHPYRDNFIKSSKYTPWNFLPRQLFAQFSKLANIYFLIVSILQMIPGLSTTGSYTTIIPLMAFVSISMAKEGYEDFRRHRLDKAENNRPTLVLRTSALSHTEATEHNQCPVDWTPVKWHALRVGDIVKVARNEAVPADIVLMNTRSTNNIAYVETMALDGETNLKPKQVSAALVGQCCVTSDILRLYKTEVVVEDANLDLYNFEGRVSINSSQAPLTNNEILYRGSILRNTTEATGVVVYSGEDCKIRMNANKHPRVKAPSLQAAVNKIVVFMVIFVFFLALFNTIAYQVWHVKYEQKAWYLTDAHVSFGPIIISFIIMFNTMIPLSLYVSMEIIKVAQMLSMNGDIDMYDEASNTPFEARTSTINEELGQVNYIFSDKTGTLTENVMAFRRMSIAGARWLHIANSKDGQQQGSAIRTPVHKDPRQRQPSFQKATGLMQDASSDSKSRIDVGDTPRRSIASWRSAGPGISTLELTTADMRRYIQHHPQAAFSSEAKMMILAMALCHTCLPERTVKDGITYQASSPDELALVQATRELGVVVYERTVYTLTLQTFPNGVGTEPVYEKYEILDIIEFSSTRKRMSVIVRFPDGRICVICKGADSVITDRLRLATLAHRKTAEIEQRINDRRSTELQDILRRKSEQTDRRNSIKDLVRGSISVPRVSIGRSSLSRRAYIGDDEDGGGKIASTTLNIGRTPRPSGQLARESSSYSDRTALSHPEAFLQTLIDEATGKDESTVIDRCFQHLNDFATEGLRTLLYSHRFITDEEYWAWKKTYQNAQTSLIDRQAKIEAAGELIEQDLEVTGATAIEDKLQQGVPETIERLRQADIKMWMLTGDKRETAITIGHSCRLIRDYSSVIILDQENSGVADRIASTILSINDSSIAHSVVVIDGRTLALIQADSALHTLLIDLVLLADSVICCRASPSQKAHLVHSIRRRVKGCVTLAVGDGANDIAMIQEAHVGIGITGKEGLQAARTADYSIAQFRFLGKLLLVHGHWNYVRVCKYTLATFWKEMLFYLTQAAFQRWDGYTGTSLYEQWSLSQFNTLFTSLPVILLGIFEKDLAAETLIAVPQLYSKGQRFAGFNFRVYFWWIFMAASEAMVVFFTMRGLWGQALFTHGLDLYSMGELTFTACIVIIKYVFVANLAMCHRNR